MEEVTVIGIDLAKSVFQLHGATASGRPVFRKKLSRAQLIRFIAEQPPCLVAMEACASSHYWGREFLKLGHEVRLIPPIYVKLFVKRQKNDANDAEAIAEAVVRPTMRFVPVKSEEQQARSMVFKTRDLLVRQRNALINALRVHLLEYGIIAPAGRTFVKKLEAQINAPENDLPSGVIELCHLHLEQIGILDDRTREIQKRLKDEAKSDPETIRLQTAPGVGPISAMAIRASAPQWRGFGQDATLPPGWVLFPFRSRPVAGGFWGAPPRWATRHPKAVDHRRDDAGQMGGQERPSQGILARADAGAQAPDAGGHHPWQTKLPAQSGR